MSAAVTSPVTSSAPPCMWCTRCMQVARISRPQVLRCRPQQQQVAMGCERHAVAQVDTGASWLLALGRFRSAWPLHPLTSRSSSCHRMAGACSAKVLVATADRRVVSRPRVRQSAAPPRHERPPTQTRPFASVPALVAAVFGPAVGSAAPMSVAVNAADLQLHWQYVRRSRVHGNQRICTCGMLAAPRSSLPRAIGV